MSYVEPQLANRCMSSGWMLDGAMGTQPSPTWSSHFPQLQDGLAHHAIHALCIQ